MVSHHHTPHTLHLTLTITPSHSTHPHRKNHHSNMPRGNEIAMEASVALKVWQPKLVEYYISGQTDKFRGLLRSMEEVIAQRGNISHSTATLVSTPPSHPHTLTPLHLHHPHTITPSPPSHPHTITTLTPSHLHHPHTITPPPPSHCHNSTTPTPSPAAGRTPVYED